MPTYPGASSLPAGVMRTLLQNSGSPYTYVNSAPVTIASYNVPNDGNFHAIRFDFVVVVTVAQTGGQIVARYTVDGALQSNQVHGGNQGITTGAVFPGGTAICDPGTTFSLIQNSALTAGASTLSYCIQTDHS